MAQRVTIFCGVLLVAFLLSRFDLHAVVGLRLDAWWGIATILAACVAWFWPLEGRRVGGAGRPEFLCDACRDNDARYCSRPERPNATRCPDFR